MTLLGRVHSRAVFQRRVLVLARHVAALLPRDARVLDVGCGDGSLARRIMELRDDVDITGIDLLVRPMTYIDVKGFDGESLPYTSSSFDVVTFVDVLHHTQDPCTLLREAARVAARAVVVKDHLTDPRFATPTLRLMDWVGNAHHGVELPYNYWSSSRWKRAFDELSLKVDVWTTDLNLYPPPAHWLFDRRLHVLCRAVPAGE
jgi:SAM-dependent methyltransferase